ncbi:uncharacterized protein PG998_011361 [Apiospora kogelbergensis]|uniref:uncharacterized protein n=1 Tax=Apiospora kogelbergensis TaxID=1337665 RepID=UPI00312FAAF0
MNVPRQVSPLDIGPPAGMVQSGSICLADEIRRVIGIHETSAPGPSGPSSSGSSSSGPSSSVACCGSSYHTLQSAMEFIVWFSIPIPIVVLTTVL